MDKAVAVVAKAAVVGAVKAASPTITGISKAVSLRRHCEERKRVTARSARD